MNNRPYPDAVLHSTRHDLSSQLGSPFNTDTSEFQQAVDRVLRAANRHDIAPGYWIGLEDAAPYIEEGWQVLSLGSDAALLGQAVQERIDNTPWFPILPS